MEVKYPRDETLMDAKEDSVIRVRLLRGQGDNEESATREVIQYYTKDGRFIGEFDPVKEKNRVI